MGGGGKFPLSFRRYMPTRFLINQYQVITFIVLKSDIIES